MRRTLKNHMTSDEYRQVRRLQLELLQATSKKEAELIRGEIEMIFQHVKARFSELNRDENAATYQ
ncbi:hypothetical protein GCM10008967_19700 [Bacillus carboniphilus]|uniref:Uncharacterized protein n=1 Tax=Bacillus carboniphilus TaxID=86663 RepID=A0ABN0W8Y9_9BACI